VNSAYLLRLLCLCLASFFAVNSVAGLLVSSASRAIVRMAESMRARSAARFLLAIRLLPSLLAILVVLALCLPSYLWLEPHASSERIGWVCLALALLGAAAWLVSFGRVARAASASARFHREWKRPGCKTLLSGLSARAIVVEGNLALLALAGVFRARLIISQAVLHSLSPEELELALQHENAHRSSRDNLKRFFLLLAPSPIPLLRGFSSIERQWTKFSEWAADDEAVRGDSHRALSLAAALLRVARMGAAPRLSFLHTSLCADDHELSARVERLLAVQTSPVKPQASTKSFMFGSCLGISVFAGFVLSLPATLGFVHRMLELFLR